jgi:hypothetical protein
MSTDRIFQALEEALPWSQSRKLRHEQRAKIKVPVAATTSKLGWRAGRMVKPYARSHQRMTISGSEPTNIDAAEHPKNSDSLLVKRSHTTKDASSQEREGAVVQDEKVPLKVTSLDQAPSFLRCEPQPAIPPELSSTASTFLPPLHSIPEDQEPAEPLPFALVPANAVPAVVNESNCSQEPLSSLRERRTRTFAVHASSVPRRPPGIDKRPNRFALDDGEDIRGGEPADPEETELKQWASKSGIALEVPTGWSFGPASLPAATKNVATMTGQRKGDGAETTAETSRSTVNMCKYVSSSMLTN